MAMPASQTPDLLTTAPPSSRLDWRSILFRGAVVVILLLLTALLGPSVLSPWTPAGPASATLTPELHRWHNADITAFAFILVGGSLLAASRQPRRTPLLVQVALLAIGLLVGAALVPLNLSALVPSLVIGGLVLATYPAPRTLLRFTPVGGSNRPLLALALAATPLLLVNAWTNLTLQYTDLSEHTQLNHWSGSAVLAIALLLAGFLAASQRPGWRSLGVVVGLTYLYLGVAALALPFHDGSWGTLGGLLALAGGIGFLAATAVEGRPARGALTTGRSEAIGGG